MVVLLESDKELLLLRCPLVEDSRSVPAPAALGLRHPELVEVEVAVLEVVAAEVTSGEQTFLA